MKLQYEPSLVRSTYICSPQCQLGQLEGQEWKSSEGLFIHIPGGLYYLSVGIIAEVIDQNSYTWTSSSSEGLFIHIPGGLYYLSVGIIAEVIDQNSYTWTSSQYGGWVQTTSWTTSRTTTSRKMSHFLWLWLQSQVVTYILFLKLLRLVIFKAGLYLRKLSILKGR